MTTELTLPERAAVALGSSEHEKQLRLLVEESKTITEIKNLDARTQCHAAYMKLKNTRIAIQKVGKDARDDAAKFCKAVIAEENRLIDITTAEETRLQGLRDQWDAAVEAERQAKIEAERQRVARIRKLIEEVRAYPLQAVGKSSEEISQMIYQLSGTPNYESFEEFADEFKTVRLDVLDKLAKAETAQKAAEFEARQIAKEREELARLKAEAEQRRQEQERQAAEVRAAQEAELKAAREKQEAELATQREELARQQVEIDAQNAAIAEAKRLQEEADAQAAEKLHVESTTRAVTFGEVLHATLPTELAEALAPTVAEPGIPSSIIADTGARMKLGDINSRLGMGITAEFLASLGFQPVSTERGGKWYRAVDFKTICAAIIRHVEFVSQEPAKAA